MNLKPNTDYIIVKYLEPENAELKGQLGFKVEFYDAEILATSLKEDNPLIKEGYKIAIGSATGQGIAIDRKEQIYLVRKSNILFFY